MMTRNGAMTRTGRSKCASNLGRGIRHESRHGAARPAASTPRPIRKSQGSSRPSRPDQQGEHAQPRGAQAEVEGQPLAQAEARRGAAEPRSTSSPSPIAAGHDQRGGSHDRQPLGQVLDVAQLVERLAEERLAEGRVGDDLRETPSGAGTRAGASPVSRGQLGSGSTRNQPSQASSRTARIRTNQSAR